MIKYAIMGFSAKYVATVISVIILIMLMLVSTKENILFSASKLRPLNFSSGTNYGVDRNRISTPPSNMNILGQLKTRGANVHPTTLPVMFRPDTGRLKVPATVFQTDERQNVELSTGSSPGKHTPFVIYAKMRTGSTFTSQFFLKHRDVFYSYEPLQVFPNRLLNNSMYWIERVTSCRFEELWKAALRSPKRTAALQQVWKRSVLCFKYDKADDCYNQNIPDIEKKCLTYKAVAAKVIRISSLTDLVQFMQKGAKVVHLIRDPRGVASSRMRIQVGSNKTSDLFKTRYKKSFSTLKSDILKYCHDLRQDLNEIHNLQTHERSLLDSAHVFLRYEDLALDPFIHMDRMYKTVGIPRDPNVTEWVHDFTGRAKGLIKVQKGQREMAYNTYRKNTTETAFRWRDHIPFSLVEVIQNNCHDIMAALGYLTVNSEAELSDRSVSVLADFAL